MCLDVLRAMFREAAAIPAILAELESVRGENVLLDTAIDRLAAELGDPEDLETRARQLTELIALTLQATILVQHAPSPVSDAFCATRLGPHWLGSYGTLPAGTDFNLILERALPIG